MWQAFWAIAYKEVVQAIRNKGMLRHLLMMQCMNLVLLAWIDLNVRHMPTVIVDQDHSAESRELIKRVTATKTFDIEYVTSSTEQARGHIRAGRAKVALVIPDDYSRLRLAGEEAHVLALVDGSDSTSSKQAEASLSGITSRMNLEAQAESVDVPPAVNPRSILLFNPQGSTSNFMLPGLLAIILGFGYSFLATMGLASERAGGNLERLIMTPMNYQGLILGKLAPYFVIGMFNAIGYLLIMRWGFGVPIRGDIVLLLGAIALYLLTVLAMGSFAAAGAQNADDAFALWGILLFPTTMMTGYIFPLSSLPKALLPVAYLLPQTHFINVMRGICLRGASAVDLAPDVLYLVFAPIALTLGAAHRFSKSIMQ